MIIVTTEELCREISVIVKQHGVSNFMRMSTQNMRLMLEQKLGISLIERIKEIDKIMAIIKIKARNR